MCDIFTYLLAAGSRFWQNGTFEVTKSEVDPAELLDPANPSTPPHTQSPLQISVPSELEGVVYIQVVIKRLSGMDGGWTRLKLANIDSYSAAAIASCCLPVKFNVNFAQSASLYLSSFL